MEIKENCAATLSGQHAVRQGTERVFDDSEALAERERKLERLKFIMLLGQARATMEQLCLSLEALAVMQGRGKSMSRILEPVRGLLADIERAVLCASTEIVINGESLVVQATKQGGG